MQYFDPDAGASLKAAFEETIAGWSEVSTETMFGCPSYRARETIFAVLNTDSVALTRLPEEDREAVEAAFEAGPFEAGGRTISKWVQVFVEDPAALEDLESYIEASYEAALAESS